MVTILPLNRPMAERTGRDACTGTQTCLLSSTQSSAGPSPHRPAQRGQCSVGLPARLNQHQMKRRTSSGGLARSSMLASSQAHQDSTTMMAAAIYSRGWEPAVCWMFACDVTQIEGQCSAGCRRLLAAIGCVNIWSWHTTNFSSMEGKICGS